MCQDDSFVDHYEVLQLSSNADADAIQRVFRLLAQRYHPDNKETGNAKFFDTLMSSYRVLADPEGRAAYDCTYQAHQKLRWKIFDQESSCSDKETERRQRWGVLSLLYNKRIKEPSKPTMTLLEIEGLLLCAREHLEFSIWYLRERKYVTATDGGRFFITADGVDATDELAQPALRTDRLLTAARENEQAEKAANSFAAA